MLSSVGFSEALLPQRGSWLSFEKLDWNFVFMAKCLLNPTEDKFQIITWFVHLNRYLRSVLPLSNCYTSTNHPSGGWRRDKFLFGCRLMPIWCRHRNGAGCRPCFPELPPSPQWFLLQIIQSRTERQPLSVSDRLARGLHIFKFSPVCVFDLPLGKCQGSRRSSSNTRPGATLCLPRKIALWWLVGVYGRIEGTEDIVCVFVCQPKMCCCFCLVDVLAFWGTDGKACFLLGLLVS